MTPFVKWAGGKGQLVDRIKARMPAEFGRYYEPFVGGGALLMAIAPERGCINDVNPALINTYRAIRDCPSDLVSLINSMDSVTCFNAFYKACREEYNKLIAAGQYNAQTAALFIFLNKHCFNGLYRVNGKGEFNVPWNKKESGSSISVENILELSDFLKGIEIRCGDFEDAVQDAQPGDFIFFDSPYAPLNGDSFEKYTKDGFSEEEHRRLAALFTELTERSCYCMATNHDTPLIRGLYSKFNIEVVPVRRSINSNAEKRTGTEVIICNYDPAVVNKKIV